MQQQVLRATQPQGSTPQERLTALAARMEMFRAGEMEKPQLTDFVNNHIHTIYSFSPYSPTGAAYTAWLNGLTTAGIMDHDSVAGAKEFIAAGEAIGIATTVGFECRCKMEKTPFAGRRINNPDQDSVAYVACHGIPHQSIDTVQAWLAPYREQRNLRNRRMVDNINNLLAGSGVSIDFDKDVAPLSENAAGGSITERHILYALAFAITEACGRGQPVVDFLKEKLNIEVAGKALAGLQDAQDEAYEYGLLGVLKAHMVTQFYIDADAECPDVAEFLTFVREIGGISAYAYLGDVGSSVTGDKRAQKFEDDYLDELVPWLAEAGFMALTYMPTRNTPEQLARVIEMCDHNGLFQISGEDINSPSQSFICQALKQPQFGHLITNTWALIGHEVAATVRLEDGMFSEKMCAAFPSLHERIEAYAQIGKRHFAEQMK